MKTSEQYKKELNRNDAIVLIIFLTAIIVLSFLSSCTSASSRSGRRNIIAIENKAIPVSNRTVLFKAYHGSITCIIKADSAFKPGEVIASDMIVYKLIERVK